MQDNIAELEVLLPELWCWICKLKKEIDGEKREEMRGRKKENETY